MKVKYIGEKTYGLTIGKEYTVISIDDGDYHIHEDDGREWTYPHKDFEITEPDNGETPKLFYVMDDREDWGKEPLPRTKEEEGMLRQMKERIKRGDFDIKK